MISTIEDSVNDLSNFIVNLPFVGFGKMSIVLLSSPMTNSESFS